MNRRRRQGALLRLVGERELGTQAEVAAALRESGFEVVQTTVSRDIAELGLVKVRGESGRFVYAPAGSRDREGARRLSAALRRYALAIEPAAGLVVVRTPSGHASALAQVLDESVHPAIAATLAGDNTIFVAPREGTTARALADELNGDLMEGAA